MRRRALDRALLASIGDTGHRRDTTADFAAVAVPLVLLATVVFVLAVRHLNPEGLRAQWRHERAELRAAKALR